MPSKPSDVHSVREVLRMGRGLAAIGHPPDWWNEAQRLAEAMDRFNELFASKGWIVHDFMEVDIVENVLTAAAAGDLSKAQGLLVEYYRPAWIARHLPQLSSIRAFAPRMRLALLALEDYRFARYHACVPVVLALLDGMVNEVGITGFFSKKTDLAAWDSIAACDSGLPSLKSALDDPRPLTDTKPLDIPLRNGILHGMDLGYDNEMVAAKSWAALFAASDFVRRVEQGRKDEPTHPPEAAVEDIRSLFERNERDNARLAAWKPRDPARTDLSSPAAGTPEAALTSFLNAWKERSFGRMAQFLVDPDAKPVNVRAGDLRCDYRGLILHEFSIVRVLDKTMARTEIEVHGRGTRHGLEFKGKGMAILSYSDAHGRIDGYAGPDGRWFVVTENPWHDYQYPTE